MCMFALFECEARGIHDMMVTRAVTGDCSESWVSHLRAADKKHEARNSSDSVERRNVREIVKVVADVVLQESHSRLLPVRLCIQI